MLRAGARLLRHALGALRALSATISKNSCGDSAQRKDDTDCRDLARPHERMARVKFPSALLREQPLGGFARLALLTEIAAAFDHPAQYVVREFDPAYVEALLDAQQAAVDQSPKRAGRGVSSAMISPTSRGSDSR